MLSVLTVNYQSAADVLGLAESLAAHRGDEAIELIVANHSPAEPVVVPPFAAAWMQVFAHPNRGFAAGINAALARAIGDLVVVMNPDVRATAGALTAARRALEAQPDVGLLLPRLRYPDGRVQLSARRFYTWPVALWARSPLRMLGVEPAFFRAYRYEDCDLSRPTDVDWGMGAAMILRRCDIGDTLFDERFFLYFEDVDLCYRTWLAGRRVRYQPDIEFVHAHRRASTRILSRHARHHLRSVVRFVYKYRGFPQRPAVAGHAPAAAG